MSDLFEFGKNLERFLLFTISQNLIKKTNMCIQLAHKYNHENLIFFNTTFRISQDICMYKGYFQLVIEMLAVLFYNVLLWRGGGLRWAQPPLLKLGGIFEEGSALSCNKPVYAWFGEFFTLIL